MDQNSYNIWFITNKLTVFFFRWIKCYSTTHLQLLSDVLCPHQHLLFLSFTRKITRLVEIKNHHFGLVNCGVAGYHKSICFKNFGSTPVPPSKICVNNITDKEFTDWTLWSVTWNAEPLTLLVIKLKRKKQERENSTETWDFHVFSFPPTLIHVSSMFLSCNGDNTLTGLLCCFISL